MTEKEFKEKLIETLEFFWSLVHTHDHLNSPTYLCKTTLYEPGTLESLEAMKEHLSKSKAFKKPTPEEAEAEGAKNGYQVDGQSFCDFYESKNWMVGKTKMKDWKAALRRACKDGWCLVPGTAPSTSAHKCKFCRTRPADGKSKDGTGQSYYWCRVCQPKKYERNQP